MNRYCPNCGMILGATQEYCPNCGEKVDLIIKDPAKKEFNPIKRKNPFILKDPPYVPPAGSPPHSDSEDNHIYLDLKKNEPFLVDRKKKRLF